MQPVGMHLKEGNRWAKKAQIIPWLEIERRYAALFKLERQCGKAALALGACIIQAVYDFSDEETALQIQENLYLQYFRGYFGCDDEYAWWARRWAGLRKFTVCSADII